MAYFNPRTPCGVRPRAAGRSSSKDKQFQSTHPVRGATRAVFPARRRPHISIHAPRAGCDVVGGSCHAQGRISIHAPRAGCDFCEIFKNCQIIHFNPRTPCGVRPYLARPCILEFLFQSTHPVRGATWFANRVRRNGLFQSTHPVRGATAEAHRCRKAERISIHAPRAGCDVGVASRCADRGRFQSTHPVRGATANMYNLVCSYFCNFTKSDVCLLTLYLFYHAISTENVVFSRFSAVRSAPGIHVRSRFAPRQSISSPSGA